MIVDPPRKGCGDDFLRQLAAFAPRTIVYVSCNPETQARDLGAAARGRLPCLGLQPFDMFPRPATSSAWRRWPRRLSRTPRRGRRRVGDGERGERPDNRSDDVAPKAP